MSHRNACLIAVGLAVAALAAPGSARAHGSLPISVRILRTPNAPTMYMPVFYWGVWVGEKDGPWKWICEEAINGDRFRRYAIATDGTLYATSDKGVSFSRQNGCEWPTATGELAALKTKDVAADPTDPATAFVAAGSDALDDGTGKRTPAPNGLFVTHDRGDSWARLAGIGTTGRTFDSVRVAPSNHAVLYATSTNYAAPFDHALHRSDDGGLSFVTAPMPSLSGRGDPSSVEILAVDPRDPRVIYARVGVTDGETDKLLQLLVRIVNAGDATQVADELTSVAISTLSGNWNSGINDVAFDLAANQLYVATRNGLLQGSAALASQPITLAPTSWSSGAQCVDVSSGELFLCGSVFDAGSAAIMSGSTSAASLSPFFNFTGTVGPIDCPAGTVVHDVCGPVWTSYAFQLGIGSDPSADAGTASGGGGSGGCAYAGVRETSAPTLWFTGLLTLALWLTSRRSGPCSAP